MRVAIIMGSTRDIDTEFFTALKEYVGTGDYQTSSEMIDQYLNSI